MKGRRTLKNRMLAVTLLIAVPVFSVLFFMNMANRDAMRREILQEYQAKVIADVAKVDVLFNLLEESLISFPLNNSDLRTVADAGETDKDFWLANQRLLNGIHDMNSVSSADFMAFLYFPGKDIFYNYQEDEELTAYIKKQIHHLSQDRPERWQMVETGDDGYFVRVLDYNKYYIGIWISYDNVFHFLDAEDESGVRYKLEKTEDEMDNMEPQGIWGKKEREGYGVWASSNRSFARLVLYLEKNVIEGDLPGLTDGFLWLLAVMVLIFAVYIWCSYRWMIAPMERLRQSMEIIEAGDVKHRISQPVGSSEEFVSITEQFNTMMDQLDRLQYELYEGRLERQEVELQYLSQQIQPHFILNTLNTLYNYSESDVQTAQDIIRLVSKYYRYVVNVNSRYVQLEHELEHIGNYLELQKIRYPKAFDYEIQCDETLGIIPVPPFLVESFISNAIKYGRTAGELIHIRIQVEEVRKFCIRIRISDTGEGFSEDMLDILQEYFDTGDTSEINGIGIRNSIQRLRLIYQDRASIRFYNQEPQGAVVEIKICVSQSE